MATFLIVTGGLFFIAALVIRFKGPDKNMGPGHPLPSDDAEYPDTESNLQAFDQISAVAVGQHDPTEIPPWELALPSLPSDDQRVVELYKSPLFCADIKSLRHQMETALAEAGTPLPTPSQWEMILSPARATRVIAGAGAGKSTALSLRVVFMHKFLGIPLSEISVVTFTRASRADMVKKLIRDMKIFDVTLSEEAARRVVRTFHSMILAQAVGNTASVTYFEQIGGRAEAVDDTESLGTLNPKQLDHLRQAFAATYRDNVDFRRAIGQILLEKLSTPRQSQYGDAESLERAIAVAEPRDRLVAQAITDAWQAKPGFDPKKDDIVWETVAIKTSKAGGVWYANGRIISNDMLIVLGCGGISEAAKDPLDRKRYPVGEADKDRTLNFLGNVRLKVLATIAIEKYLYIETDDDLADLYTWVDWVHRGQLLEDKGTFPAFSLRVPGDTSSASIFECLYSVGAFIASMGMEVTSGAHAIAEQLGGIKDCKLETNLCRALAEFWPALHSAGNGTYDDLFLQHGIVEYTETLPATRLSPMKNLLIDEFQDISGQIVQWIQAVHTVLVGQGGEPSLMAVGDDWQSVYGWRGSDPEYMIRFDKHFGESKLVVMTENFRCGQHIINTAEILVSRLVETALQKHGVASGHAAESLGDVELCTGGDKEVLNLIEALKAEDPTGKIFILSRTNEGLVPFRKLAKDSQITLLTMHRAKGLEADYVIIKGDCNYDSVSPLKNAVYAQAGMQTRYDTAQRDESLRLAYVSLTRAKKKAFWFGEPSKPGGAFRLLNEVLSGGAIYENTAER